MWDGRADDGTALAKGVYFARFTTGGAVADERKLVDEGFTASRRLVMHNDFVLVGPAADPARIRGSASSADAPFVPAIAPKRAAAACLSPRR